jgi:hypothetical protein
VLKKRKALGVEITPPPMKKMGGMKRRRKASSQMGDKTSKQELLLAKQHKLSKKFAVKRAEAHSSGLSVSEMASFVRPSFGPPMVASTGLRKAPMTHAEKDALGYVSTDMINMEDTVGAHKTPIACANMSSKCIK